MSDTSSRERRTATCMECGKTHEATFSHVSEFGGHDVFAVVCDVDWLTSYYTPFGLDLEQAPAVTAADLGLDLTKDA